MLRLARSPRWVGGLLLAMLAAAACSALGRWQWDRSQSAGGDLQNLAYAFNWWLFAALSLWFWWKALRDEVRHREAQAGAADGSGPAADGLAGGAAGEAAGGAAGGVSGPGAAAVASRRTAVIPATPISGQDAELDEWNAWLAELDSRRRA